jgi:hypothetical protein
MQLLLKELLQTELHIDLGDRSYTDPKSDNRTYAWAQKLPPQVVVICVWSAHFVAEE